MWPRPCWPWPICCHRRRADLPSQPTRTNTQQHRRRHPCCSAPKPRCHPPRCALQSASPRSIGGASLGKPAAGKLARFLHSSAVNPGQRRSGISPHTQDNGVPIPCAPQTDRDAVVLCSAGNSPVVGSVVPLKKHSPHALEGAEPWHSTPRIPLALPHPPRQTP